MLTLYPTATDPAATAAALAGVAAQVEHSPDESFVVAALAAHPNTPPRLNFDARVTSVVALADSLARATADTRRRVLDSAQTATLARYANGADRRGVTNNAELFTTQPDIAAALAQRLGASRGHVRGRAAAAVLDRPDADPRDVRTALLVALEDTSTFGEDAYQRLLTRATSAGAELPALAERAAPRAREDLQPYLDALAQGRDPHRARLDALIRDARSSSATNAWANLISRSGDLATAELAITEAQRDRSPRSLAVRSLIALAVEGCAALRGTSLWYEHTRPFSSLSVNDSVTQRDVWTAAAGADRWDVASGASMLPETATSDDIEVALRPVAELPAPGPGDDDSDDGLRVWHMMRLSLHPAATQGQRSVLARHLREHPTRIDGLDDYSASAVSVAEAAVLASDARAWATSTPLAALRDGVQFAAAPHLRHLTTLLWRDRPEVTRIAARLEPTFTGSMRELLEVATSIAR